MVVGGRYRLESILGQGGMAVVWRAEHTETGRIVALKLVRPELAAHDTAREMFVREARVASRVGRSEHIVDVLDAGVDPELGLPFLAMELLEGETLDATLGRSGAPPREIAISLLEQIAEALDQAHAAGVIHRDLKPQNLFVTQGRQGPRIKVLDFGIAKAAETVQQSATQIGTPAYAAPEQLGATWRSIAERNGRAVASQVSPATDVWALGLIAYELFTGAPSGQFWGAETLAELPAKVFLEPLPAATLRAASQSHALPAGFDAWLARCLDLDATRRWPSAGEAVRNLRAEVPQTAAPIAAAPQVAVAPPRAPSVPPRAPSLPPAAHALAWAVERGIHVTEGGDPQTYASWGRYQYVPPIHAVVREGRLRIHDAEILVAEVAIQDELRRAIGEAHMLIALIGCPRVRHHIALRTKKITGIGDGLSRGLKALDSLVSSKPKSTSVLGDAWFEARFEVTAPDQQEANLALPSPARLLLGNSGFTGIVETRPGGAVVALEPARFDRANVERLLDTTARLLACYA